MTYTRKQAVTCISIVFLLLATGLAGYATSRIDRLSLPIPASLSYVTTLLPIISGLLLETGYDLTRSRERRNQLARNSTQRPPFVIVANTIIFIYSTVVITLLGTHASPASSLDCGLREQWTRLFTEKNVGRIRTIQEAFSCCGLKTSRDMAWPFPDKTHKATACEETFGHTNGCLAPWKAEEQRVAGILMAVVGLVFIWQFSIIVIPTEKESWLHSVVPDRVSRMIADEEHGSSSRQAANFLPANRYSDRVQEEVSEDEDETSARRAIEGGTQRVRNVLNGEHAEEQTAELHENPFRTTA